MAKSKTPWVDSILLKVAPAKAVKNAEARSTYSQIQANGYDGAVASRHRNKAWLNKSTREADEDRLIGSYDRKRLRLECNDLYRNNDLAHSIVTRLQTYIVGETGLVPSAQTSDKEWNAQAEKFFSQWAKIADVRGRSNLLDFQKQIIKSKLTDGDCGFILVGETGQLQPIQSDRIVTPQGSDKQNIYDGVEVDKIGRPIAYHIATRDSTGRANPNNTKRYKAKDIIFCSKPDFFDQIRGIPAMACIINSLRDYAELSDAVLQKSKLNAKRAFSIHTETPLNPLPTRQNQTPEGQALQIESVEGGTIYKMGAGEKIDPLDNNHPSPQYDSYIQHIEAKISSAVGLPYAFLLFDFTKVNYASSKSALKSAHKNILEQQEWLSQYMQRIWNWRISKAIKRGELPAPPTDENGVSEFYKVQWVPPERTWIDQEGETKVNEKRLLHGTDTLTSICKGQGNEYPDVARQKADDLLIAQMEADRLNKELGREVFSYRDIALNIGAGLPPTAPVQETKTDEK